MPLCVCSFVAMTIPVHILTWGKQFSPPKWTEPTSVGSAQQDNWKIQRELMCSAETEASKASPGCGRILKNDPPSVPACSPAVTMSSLSCCLSHPTILCCLNQFWPQGSIYMRLTRPNIQTLAHVCVFSDARTHATEATDASVPRRTFIHHGHL